MPKEYKFHGKKWGDETCSYSTRHPNFQLGFKIPDLGVQALFAYISELHMLAFCQRVAFSFIYGQMPVSALVKLKEKKYEYFHYSSHQLLRNVWKCSHLALGRYHEYSSLFIIILHCQICPPKHSLQIMFPLFRRNQYISC